MNRREALSAIGAGLGLPIGMDGLLSWITHPVRKHRTGWLDLPRERRRFLQAEDRPFFTQHNRAVRGTGRGEQVLLWPYFESVTGKPYEPHMQEIGDCVGQSVALGVDFLTAIQIAYHGYNHRWVAKASTEAIYAGSRVEIGKGVVRDRFGRVVDGSMCAWAVKWLSQYGVLLRQKYGDVDLTDYDAQLARRWGHPNSGVPDHLEPTAREHPVRTAKLVRTWSELCDSIANGYPVAIGSGQGFQSQADEDGFLPASNERWGHAMLIVGIDDKSDRPGACFANSWGPDWYTQKPHKLGTPSGGFWADAAVVGKMLGEEDAYALSNYVGYPRRDMDYILI